MQNNDIQLGRKLAFRDYKKISSVGKRSNSEYLVNSNSYEKFKNSLVSKLFWGRSNFYKNISHALMIFSTVFITLTGVLVRVSALTGSEKSSLQVGNQLVGTNDLLQQGGSINTVLVSSTDDVLSVQWTNYT
ncbi:hypothetical protein KC669_03500, partial [Candidatus Dojkabacteria bacterium]|nr:hypothetical protein [Candidatus Dojkabacteria bacterium]